MQNCVVIDSESGPISLALAIPFPLVFDHVDRSSTLGTEKIRQGQHALCLGDQISILVNRIVNTRTWPRSLHPVSVLFLELFFLLDKRIVVIEIDELE